MDYQEIIKSSNESRGKILTRLKIAKEQKIANGQLLHVEEVDFQSDVYQPYENKSLIEIFEYELLKVFGKFVYIPDSKNLVEVIKNLFSQRNFGNVFCIEPDFKEILFTANIPYISDEDKFLDTNTTVTGCEYLIARFGSVMVSSKQGSGRKLFVYPDTHIVIAYTSQLVNEIEEALIKVKKKYLNDIPGLITLITGPSRTADIEKTLVMGAHGPKEFYVILVNE